MSTIMIIDDDAAIRDVYSLVFAREGYSVVSYSNEKPLLVPGFPEPDIFLIDKQLNGANGIDLCRFLKSRAAPERFTPVIIFSASNIAARQAKEAGAEAFLEKPFPNKLLLETVQQILNIKTNGTS